MSFIWMIIVGLVAGLLARAIKPGSDPMGWIMTIILGIAGALLGGFIGSFLGLDPVNSFSVKNIIVASAGAILLLWLYRRLRKR